jgi:integrase/recombinase XerD
VPYQYVREPLTADESDRLSNPCETTTERLVVWTLLDTGLRVGELCRLTLNFTNIHIQEEFERKW